MSNYPLEIEKNVPHPKGMKNLIPFAKMEVGDSVLYPIQNQNDHRNIGARVYRYNQKKQGKFSCIKIDEHNLRIYRIE
jgi:hypothetical protein